MKSLFHRTKPPQPTNPPLTTTSTITPAPTHPPIMTSDPPLHSNWDSAHTTIGAGVAIFHLCTNRVVLCHHPLANHYFLPKGRRNTNEETGPAAEREGYEESGYRNRLLPLPLPTRQTPPPTSPPATTTPFITEPLWTQLVPVTQTAQYILFWYIAETVPPHLDAALTTPDNEYRYPPRFPADMTLAQRVQLEDEGYEPVRHQGTGVGEEEALYESCLVSVGEAVRRLGNGVEGDVVRRGWEAIVRRRRMEGEGGEEVE